MFADWLLSLRSYVLYCTVRGCSTLWLAAVFCEDFCFFVYSNKCFALAVFLPDGAAFISKNGLFSNPTCVEVAAYAKGRQKKTKTYPLAISATTNSLCCALCLLISKCCCVFRCAMGFVLGFFFLVICQCQRHFSQPLDIETHVLLRNLQVHLLVALGGKKKHHDLWVTSFERTAGGEEERESRRN